ncbi:MAG TPA: fumarylacetoacetate hydrolase family protein [Steroidobacteraceae bacterium]|jgi:2-keto-4-pentenoate hydratase/2-oxohepta-3-ene-1,7-dioic acid hydratase in catechol pathway|nr:fumarylacetoacetate hydrolase family protein [Steroidobacteraceae bacterium]
MKLVTFVNEGLPVVGVLVGNSVIAVAASAERVGAAVDLSSMLAVINGGEEACKVIKQIETQPQLFPATTYALKNVTLLAPIPKLSRNAFCVGRNYADHVKEGFDAQNKEVSMPAAPQFFTKATNAINSPTGDIKVREQVTHWLDYEVELAVIIGKGGCDIAKENAFDHVFGYTVANDVTARDLQKRHEQWFKGKSLDTTLPLGPCIVTRDAIKDVDALELTSHVNGERRQHGQVSQMMFDIPAIVASLSSGMTLEPGDVICTGTPAGVGFAMKPPQKLKNGDVVTATITHIGELRNRIVIQE